MPPPAQDDSWPESDLSISVMLQPALINSLAVNKPIIPLPIMVTSEVLVILIEIWREVSNKDGKTHSIQELKKERFCCFF